jgi:hypothetical protein
MDALQWVPQLTGYFYAFSITKAFTNTSRGRREGWRQRNCGMGTGVGHCNNAAESFSLGPRNNDSKNSGPFLLRTYSH